MPFRRLSNCHIKTSYSFLRKAMAYLLSFYLSLFIMQAQNCPPNIDFEKGDFSGWTCYVGNVSAAGGVNTIYLSSSGGPVADQHTMYSAANDGSVTDYYGHFPVMCPNGSLFSVKLGNNTGGAQAEGLSYDFTIPANRNTYSLIYHYAVVFQDPAHLDFQQPRLELEITNVTDNELITCSSFTFFPMVLRFRDFLCLIIRIQPLYGARTGRR